MTCVRVGVIPKALGNSAFELARIGAEEAIAEYANAELFFDGPVRPTIAGQIATVEDFVARGVHVLAVNANDPRKLLPCLTAAEKLGIHIMTWDAGVETGGRLLHVCPSKDEVLAAVWLQLLCDAIHGEGEFAILSTTEEAPNQNRWIDAIRRRLETDEFKDIHLSKVVYGGDIADLSHAKVLALTKASRDLKAILCLTGVGLAAAAEAIENSGQVGRVYATGLGYPSEIAPFLDRGAVKSFAVWSMIDLGYAAAHLAFGLATGEFKPRVGETAMVGRLGPMTIESGLELVMAEPSVYDAANVHAAARVF